MNRGEHTLRRPVEARRPIGLDRRSDVRLLEEFRARGDEGAFEAMVARHGPRVLGVCRQVLGRSAEVDDVFQATFLLLATKSASIRDPNALGAWLHGVAHRLAVRSKARSTRRLALERRAVPEAQATSEDDMDLPRLRLILHAEIDRLPDRLRRPILLCYMEGRTNQDAARLLDCPTSTLKERLSRGREVLKGRLARRGVALTSALLLMLLPSAAQAEEVAPWLVAATVEAARGRGRMGRRRPIPPIDGAPLRVVSAAIATTALLVATFAWAIFQPSPARGTVLRRIVDLAQKVCG